MAKLAAPIHFSAKLFRPAGPDKGASWMFLKLPQDVSDQLPTRSMTSVEGTFGGSPFITVLEPDGEGGHWMRVEEKLGKAAAVKAGDVVELKIGPASKEPEPEVPDDVQKALAAASAKAMETWQDITTVARRDWIKWIISGKKAETRVKRIEVAISKMTAGNRRPCCFDRSGMFDKSLSCPLAEAED